MDKATLYYFPLTSHFLWADTFLCMLWKSIPSGELSPVLSSGTTQAKVYHFSKKKKKNWDRSVIIFVPLKYHSDESHVISEDKMWHNIIQSILRKVTQYDTHNGSIRPPLQVRVSVVLWSRKEWDLVTAVWRKEKKKHRVIPHSLCNTYCFLKN